jgi:hypothetical protein
MIRTILQRAASMAARHSNQVKEQIALQARKRLIKFETQRAAIEATRSH